MERDYWHTSARSSGRLESPEFVGRIAAERAIRRLNARKVPTQKVPVVFEPRTAGSSWETSSEPSTEAPSTAMRLFLPANWAKRSPPRFDGG